MDRTGPMALKRAVNVEAWYVTCYVVHLFIPEARGEADITLLFIPEARGEADITLLFIPEARGEADITLLFIPEARDEADITLLFIPEARGEADITLLFIPEARDEADITLLFIPEAWGEADIDTGRQFFPSVTVAISLQSPPPVTTPPSLAVVLTEKSLHRKVELALE